MSAGALLRSKLSKRRVWRRLFLERLSEPLHLNAASAVVLAFGSYRSKINWDLVVRPHYAYGVLKAADLARQNGVRAVTLLEFGVASGAGLMNLADIARQVSHETGIEFQLHGFDSGSGMPPAEDYRDHPDLYQEGDFTMDVEALRTILPDNVSLHLGPLASTVPQFLAELDPRAPIGFVSFDVDYYSSTVDALEVLRGKSEAYLPMFVVYVDDVTLDQHNSACGALLALSEFSASTPLRVVERHDFFEYSRIFRRSSWLRQIYFAHVLDHPTRSRVQASSTKRYIENPYLADEEQRERFSV